MDKKILTDEFIRESLSVRDFIGLRNITKNYELADIAEVFDKLDLSEAVAFFRLVPKRKRAELFSFIEIKKQKNLLEELPDVVVSTLINEMEPDDRTRLLEDLPFEIRNKILLNLAPEERHIAWKLLSYPESSVGRLMNPDFFFVDGELKVHQGMDLIRWATNISSDFLHYIFITNVDGQLLGEVSLAAMVTCDPPSKKMTEIMGKSLVYLSPYDEQEKAVDYFRKYDRSYIPVVDENKKIIGIVTADDLFDVAEEEATEDIQQFGGTGALENSYFLTPVLSMIRKRVGSLAVLFTGQLLTGAVLRQHEGNFSTFNYLIIFLPLIISSGGNSGTQAASLILRAIAIGELDQKFWWQIFKKEFFMGVILGLVLAILGFIRALTWDYDFVVATTVSITLVGVVTFGTVAGSMLPLVFKYMKLDPAVISSPFISTLVDLAGIIIFINVAIFVMANF